MIRTRIRIPVSPMALATLVALPSTRKQIAAVMAIEPRIAAICQRVCALTNQHHHRRDGTRPSQHGNAHRHNTGVVPWRWPPRSRSPVLLGGGALGLQHVQTDKQQNDTAGDLEGRQRNAEDAEEVRSSQRKTGSE